MVAKQDQQLDTCPAGSGAQSAAERGQQQQLTEESPSSLRDENNNNLDERPEVETVYEELVHEELFSEDEDEEPLEVEEQAKQEVRSDRSTGAARLRPETEAKAEAKAQDEAKDEDENKDKAKELLGGDDANKWGHKSGTVKQWESIKVDKLEDFGRIGEHLRHLSDLFER